MGEGRASPSVIGFTGLNRSHREAHMDVMAGDVSETGGPRGWRDFVPGRWQSAIDVRDFILRNVSPYDGDESFLAGPSERTKAVWAKLQPYFDEERKKGVLDVDAARPSTLLAHERGLDRPRQRGDRRFADRPSVSSRHLPGRRPAHGRVRPQGRGIRRRPGRSRSLHKVPQDPQ